MKDSPLKLEASFFRKMRMSVVTSVPAFFSKAVPEAGGLRRDRPFLPGISGDFGPRRVQGVMASDGDEKPAGLQGVDGPGEEIVVDGEARVVLVLGVEDRISPKGKLETTRSTQLSGTSRGLLEALDKDLRFRVELGEDQPAQSVFLDGQDPGVFGDAPGA